MATDHKRLGLAVTGIGLALLLTLRFWASPVARTVTGRSSTGVIAFLAIPAFLVIFGAGIAIFLWGEELGIG